jgi:dephospho-CoA kinase
MRRVALTGGIATGKSYVLDRFRRLGVPCVDADELAHGVMAAGTEASEAIARRFGPAVLAADGSVDRAVLGPVVFRDAAARRDLEAIVHPAVRRSLAAVLQAFERDGAPAAIVALPLLHETGRTAEFDRVIATVCAPVTQRARLLARGLSEDEAWRRLEAQWPAADKTRGAHWIIHTDGSFADTDRQVDEIAAALATLPPR